MATQQAKVVWADVQDEINAGVEKCRDRITAQYEMGHITRHEADIMRACLDDVCEEVAQDLPEDTARHTILHATKALTNR